MVALVGSVGAQTELIPKFKAPVEIGVGFFPWGIAAADALGYDAENPGLDGYPDIAVAVGQLNLYNGYPNDWMGEPGEVRIFRNTKNWTNPGDALELAQVITLNPIHANTVAADVAWAHTDGDERLDLVITGTSHFQSGPNEGAWGIYVYRYDIATNRFVFHDYEPTTFPIRGLTLADFDNDGDLDVAAAVDLLEYDTNRD